MCVSRQQNGQLVKDESRSSVKLLRRNIKFGEHSFTVYQMLQLAASTSLVVGGKLIRYFQVNILVDL